MQSPTIQRLTKTLRRSPAGRTAKSAVKSTRRLFTDARFRLAGETLVVRFNNPAIGMFAQMNFCLYMARYTARTRQRLHVILDSANYVDPAHGPNWLEYFFVDRRPVQAPDATKAILITDNSQIPIQYIGLSLEEAHHLFFDKFDVQPDIARAVESQALQLGVDGRTLGVHYRATDKVMEADLVQMGDAVAKIRLALSRWPDARNVFIATDDARFLDFAKTQITECPVVNLDDSRRSTDDRPVHLRTDGPGNYAMGLDAIQNCLMLSRCGRLVRTTSFLSAWSSVFNPKLPVALLNVPRPGQLHFPESAIVPRADRL